MLCWRFFGFITLRKLYSKLRHVLSTFGELIELNTQFLLYCDIQFRLIFKYMKQALFIFIDTLCQNYI